MIYPKYIIMDFNKYIMSVGSSKRYKSSKTILVSQRNHIYLN